MEFMLSPRSFAYKNISDNWDIVLHGDFLSYPTKALAINFCNLNYFVTIGNSRICTGVADFSQVFPAEDIPLNSLKYHKCQIIFLNVKEEYLDKKIHIKLAISKNLFNSSSSVKFGDNNSLRFMGGMAGLEKSIFKSYDKNIINTVNENPYVITYENPEMNQYDESGQIESLIVSKCKYVIQRFQTIGTIKNGTGIINFFKCGDAITEISFLVTKDNLPTSIYMNFEESNTEGIQRKKNKVEYEYDGQNTISVKNLNLLTYIPTIAFCDVFMTIKYEKNTDDYIFAKYSRVVCDSEERRYIAQNKYNSDYININDIAKEIEQHNLKYNSQYNITLNQNFQDTNFDWLDGVSPWTQAQIWNNQPQNIQFNSQSNSQPSSSGGQTYELSNNIMLNLPSNLLNLQPNLPGKTHAIPHFYSSIGSINSIKPINPINPIDPVAPINKLFDFQSDGELELDASHSSQGDY